MTELTEVADLADMGTVRRLRSALTTLDVATALLVAVGAVHLALAPSHFAEWWLAGAFFLLIGLFQVGAAMAVYRSATTPRIVAVICVHVGVVVVYVVDRTTSIAALDDHRDHSYQEIAAGVQDVGALDLVTTGAEVAIVALLSTRLTPSGRRSVANGLIVVGAAFWIGRWVGLLG